MKGAWTPSSPCCANPSPGSNNRTVKALASRIDIGWRFINTLGTRHGCSSSRRITVARSLAQYSANYGKLRIFRVTGYSGPDPGVQVGLKSQVIDLKALCRSAIGSSAPPGGSSVQSGARYGSRIRQSRGSGSLNFGQPRADGRGGEIPAAKLATLPRLEFDG